MESTKVEAILYTSAYSTTAQRSPLQRACDVKGSPENMRCQMVTAVAQTRPITV